MKSKLFWALPFLLAAVLWMVHIDRPVDLPSWHEFDYSSISRNFVRESNNILLPRIDWRGDGPGFTEMEFPIIPWTTAQVYRVTGIHELIGRISSYIFALLSLFVFSRLALKLLPEGAALAATIFFASANLVLQIATAIQPESLMLLLYLSAVYCFYTWYQQPKWTTYCLAIVCFSGAMLVKSPAAHLAILFFLWALHKDGPKAFLRPSLYAFAVLSFAPALLWYSHAASLWHHFHNSMGVSNEDHWIAADIFRRPKVFTNLFGIDLLLVGGIGGFVVAFAAIAKNKLRSDVNRLAAYWCLAIGIYLVVIIRTAGAYWAAYYHVIAIPPVALLFGASIHLFPIHTARAWRHSLTACLVTAAILVPLLWEIGQKDLSHLPGIVQALGVAHTSLLVLTVLTVMASAATVLCLRLPQWMPAPPVPNEISKFSAFVAPVLVASYFTYFLISGQLLLGDWQIFSNRTEKFNAACRLRDKIAAHALIVATGGICLDPGGHRVANDGPDMFYWLDRKGFTTCEGHESVSELVSFAARGAKYFVADKSSLSEQPGFESQLRNEFPVIADCGPVLLLSLQKAGDATPSR